MRSVWRRAWNLDARSRACGLRHSLFVIVTDGEEVGLMGARAAVTDVDVAARVRTFLNFDGTGTAGPTLLFETGPGWGAPLSAWAKGAPAPTGASFGTEIYKRLPNDTDFTVFKTIGASGLNFAPVADSYAYHTDRDIAPRVEAGTLDHEIGNTIDDRPRARRHGVDEAGRAADVLRHLRPRARPSTATWPAAC